MISKDRIIQETIQSIKSSHRNLAYFFLNVENPDWLEILNNKGLFKFSDNEDKDDRFHEWPQLFFLEKIAEKIVKKEIVDEKIINLLYQIITTTNYKTTDYFSNRILFKIYYSIPIHMLSSQNIEFTFEFIFKKVHNDRAMDGLFLQEVIENILSLVDKDESLTSLQLFLERSFSFIEKDDFDKYKLKYFDSYNIDRLVSKLEEMNTINSSFEGSANIAIIALINNLGTILKEDEEIDRTTIYWRSAVPLNSQTKYSDSAQSHYIYLIYTISKLLLNSNKKDFLSTLYSQNFISIKRIIVALATDFPELIGCSKIMKIYDELKLSGQYRYEMYHYLEKYFDNLPKKYQKRILEEINKIEITKSNDKEDDRRYLAYEKLRWLTALKNSKNKNAKNILNENLNLNNNKSPLHPEYSTYIDGGWVSNESPTTIDEMAKMSDEELFSFVTTFEEKNKYTGPSKSGLSQNLQKLLEKSYQKSIYFLNNIEELEYIYVSAIYDSLQKGWKEDKTTPLSLAINSSVTLLHSQKVKNDLKSNAPKLKWAISSIVSFYQSGTARDNNAFPEKYNDQIKSILIHLLELIEPDTELVISSDYFTRAINELRGKIWESLILLTLRNCRLRNNQNKTFNNEWLVLAKYLTKCLNDKSIFDYSLHALIGRYFRQFLFMNENWVYENIELLIPKDENRNECRIAFMDGWAYITVYIPRLYTKLKNQNLLMDYLRLKDNKRDRYQQSRVIDMALLAALYDNDFTIIQNIVKSMIKEEWSHTFNSLVTIIKNSKEDDLTLNKEKIIRSFISHYKDHRNIVKKDHLKSLDNTLITFSDINNPLVEEVLNISILQIESAWEFNDIVEFFFNHLDSDPKKVSELFLKSLELAAELPSYPEDKIQKIAMEVKNSDSKKFRRLCDLYTEKFLNGGILKDICD